MSLKGVGNITLGYAMFSKKNFQLYIKIFIYHNYLCIKRLNQYAQFLYKKIHNLFGLYTICIYLCDVIKNNGTNIISK